MFWELFVVSMCCTALGGVAYGVRRYIVSRFISIVLDDIRYTYIPYQKVEDKKVVDKYIKLRKPNTIAEWAFLGLFVTVMGALVYKFSTAKTEGLQLEAKRNLVERYKKFVRLGMFGALFPIACSNSADEIVAFCTHVGIYYRTASTVTDFAADIFDVFSGLFDTPNLVSESSNADTSRSGDSCQHKDECDFKTTSTPCNKFCAGHHCVHSDKCNPRDQNELKAQSGKKKNREEIHDPVFHAESGDSTSFVTNLYPVSNGTNHRFEELMAAEAAARARVENGEAKCGLGYKKDHDKPSGVWRRLKARLSAYLSSVSLYCFCLKELMIVKIIQYRWYIAGGATMAVLAGVIYSLTRTTVDSVVPPVNVAEGGKKKNRGGKKVRIDMAQARASVHRRTDVNHNISGGSDIDVYELSRREQREKEDQEIEDEAYDKAHGHYSEKMSMDKTTDLKTCSRDELLSLLANVRQTWFDKTDTTNIRKKRELLKSIFTALNTRFPRKTENKTEHLRPGSIPFKTPHMFLVRAYVNDVPVNVSAFPYANCLYVPRHGVSGATRVCVVVNNKEVVLPDKCVVVSSRPDYVQYPLPAGLPMNKQMNFRAPVKGEIATLVWVRQTEPSRPVQTIGVVGDVEYLGKDRKLKVVNFSGSSEDGSCGGIYISAVDGYNIGVHGIGADSPSVTPKFYPMTPTWYEESKDASNQVPTFVPSSDKEFEEALTDVINGRVDVTSLNL